VSRSSLSVRGGAVNGALRPASVVACEGCGVPFERIAPRRGGFILCSACCKRWQRERRVGAPRPSFRPPQVLTGLPPCATCGSALGRPHTPRDGRPPRCLRCREREQAAHRQAHERVVADERLERTRQRRRAEAEAAGKLAIRPQVLAIIAEARRGRSDAVLLAWLRARYGPGRTVAEYGRCLGADALVRAIRDYRRGRRRTR
jgi:hypothetical protein